MKHITIIIVLFVFIIISGIPTALIGDWYFLSLVFDIRVFFVFLVLISFLWYLYDIYHHYKLFSYEDKHDIHSFNVHNNAEHKADSNDKKAPYGDANDNTDNKAPYLDTHNGQFYIGISILPLFLVQLISLVKSNSWLLNMFLIAGTFVLVLGLFALVFMLLVVLLDRLYRPNTLQLPFNLILDRVVPSIVLLLPSILILSLPSSTAWITKFGYIIIIHSILIGPMFYFWSKHRSWSSQNKTNINRWSHPLFFLHMAIAIIYPAIWGLYFTIVRYLRLSENGIIITFSFDTLESITVFFFLLPHIILWILLFLRGIQHVKDFIWTFVETLLFSFHISLLRFDSYFSVLRCIHKFSFIIYNFISLVAPLNIYPFYINKYSFSLYRRVIHKLYCYPFICTITLFSMILVEILLTKRIYYGLYLLFIYPIIYSILRNIIDFVASLSFIEHVCLVDYMLLKTERIRYPYRFYFFLNDNNSHFGVVINIPKEVFNTWEDGYHYACTHYSKYRQGFSGKLLQRVSGVCRNNKFEPIPSIIYSKQAYYKRLKIAYLKTYSTRWYHTTRVLHSPLSISGTKEMYNKLHPIVLRLASSTIDHLALMDNNIPFHIIQKNADQTNKKYRLTELFTHNSNIITPIECTHFVDVVETIQAHMFIPLTEKNVIAGTIGGMRLRYPREHFASMQQNPDVGLFLGDSSLSCKQSIGIDFKNIMGKTKYSCRNQVSVGDVDTYFQGLAEYGTFLQKKHPEVYRLTESVLDQLRYVVRNGNWEAQLEVWSTNLHNFPLRGKPPLWFNKNLCRETLITSVQQQIDDKIRYFRLISKIAYNLNIPEENFSESHIQYMMNLSEEELNKINEIPCISTVTPEEWTCKSNLYQ